MKTKAAQLKARYQQYSARERNLIKTGAAALCCAAVYYGGMVPLDNTIARSQATLNRQQETLRWMRDEIQKNHLQVQQLKTTNPRTALENSAHEINLTLNDVRQDGQSLSFVINRVNVYVLKNWLREMNLTTGVRLEKITMDPVDRRSDVKAEIQLTWKKSA
ncbi:type II secretion system protein M [Leclercia adecarboxylata]|uniref:type II secretion system protein M n=1 Tax=Leclercia adecarboxylata TaxID=83655 RepID=UPI002DBBBB21|nr:type II secretion system protein M [Leclercia adecarboxylata]MEB6379132.1 type II secretion system protein M [Leclercia adecarboxylata]